MKKIFYLLILLCSLNNAFAHYIGEYYQGGVIFHIDCTGEHGLIAAVDDIGDLVKWTTWRYPTGATKDGIGAGKYNTKMIIDTVGSSGQYAALVASQCRDGGYDDWYLPSKYELDLMYKQSELIGGFYTMSNMVGIGLYWSSTEAKAGTAWAQSFIDGEVIPWGDIKSKEPIWYGAYVRPIRSF